MTTTIAAPRAKTPAPVTTATLAPAMWTLVSEGLWAGSRSGEFLGTVEFTAGAFETADHHGTPLGRSHSLAGAKRLVDGPEELGTEQVLPWDDSRTMFALGWLAFAAAAIGAISIATQFFV